MVSVRRLNKWAGTVRGGPGSDGLPEDLVAFGQEVAVGLKVPAGRDEDWGALEALDPVDEHRAVLLSEDVFSDFNNKIRPHAQDVPVQKLAYRGTRLPKPTRRPARSTPHPLSFIRNNT